MRYHEVKEFQVELSTAITATLGSVNDAGNINSIVRLMGLAEAAKIPDVSHDKSSLAYNVILSELRNIKKRIDSIDEKPVGGKYDKNKFFRYISDVNASKTVTYYDKKIEEIISDPVLNAQDRWNALDKLQTQIRQMPGDTLLPGEAGFLSKRLEVITEYKTNLEDNHDIVPF